MVGRQESIACLEQEDKDLVVFEQHSIIHNHGQGPGHFVVQPQGQKLGYIALAAAFTAASSGKADGRMLMHQLHCSTTMRLIQWCMGWVKRGGGGRLNGGVRVRGVDKWARMAS